MSTIFLQCCNTTAHILKCSCDNEFATNCEDVQIVQAICCALIWITAIIVVGSLVWRLIGICHKSHMEKRKSKGEKEEATRKTQNDLIEKLLDFLKAKATEKSENKGEKSSGKIQPQTIGEICKLLEENAGKSYPEDLRQKYICLCTSLIANASCSDGDHSDSEEAEKQKAAQDKLNNENIYRQVLCYLIELSQKDQLNTIDINNLLNYGG